MPLYEFDSCKCQRGKKVHSVIRPMSQAGDPFKCPVCLIECQRIYSFNKPKEFFQYSDEQYATEISSEKQERRLMKQHRHCYTRETQAYEKFKSQRRLARKKPVYFTPAGYSKMERD